MHVRGDVMKKPQPRRNYWPGVFGPPPPGFQTLVGPLPLWRLFLATALGSIAVLVLSHWSKSSLAGYSYGFLLFTLISWPFVPQIVKTARWRDATVAESLLLLVASMALGAFAQKILGFNPQQPGLSRMNWQTAVRMLWQFPLVLPVENALLIGAMATVWKFLRPTTAWQRGGVAMLTAALFGLWHVPFWGPWTMWTIGLSVLPWVLFMMATGDVVVPLLAHILMDTMAMVLTFGPSRSFAVHDFWLVGMTMLIVLGLTASVIRDWWMRSAKT